MDLLLREVEVLGTRADPTEAEVTSIVLDSRRVTPGALFCCLPGDHADGHDHAPAALAAGAVALLVERPLDLPVAQAVVGPGQARPTMGRLAAAFWGHPAEALTTIGVTGTNGKTTVTHLLRAIFSAAGRPTAVIGTLDGARTTPESPLLQERLAGALRAGDEVVAMEVSSHALTQARVDGFVFDAAVFTNLSHDHLDYHRTMEAYFEAKAVLFTPAHTALGVVNTGDPWGTRLAEAAGVPIVGFSPRDATEVRTVPGRTTFEWRGRTVRLPLTGAFHVVNALAAAATASALGVDDAGIVDGLAGAPPVPGRFEVVPTPAPFTVVVDYAHTPDGLAVALDSARRLAGPGRVLCVFGCGGDRDRGKRPLMGAAASAGADLVFLTSDNPRGEDPRAIIDEVLSGIADRASVQVEVDRARAIALAVASARPGDVVILAGKGHETSIEAAGVRTPFDDREEAARAVAGLARPEVTR